MPTPEQTAADALTIESDALRANLLETATDEVTIDPSLAVLEEIVSKYRGISKNLNELLYEVCHPYRNWNMLVPRLRAFVLKNFTHYLNHEKGPEAFDRFSIIFFQAMVDSPKNKTLMAQVIESLIAYTDKLISNMDHEKLMLYETVFATFFSRLYSLEEDIIVLMVQGQHPMKKTATRLLTMEKEQSAYDFKPLAILMKRILSLNYQYWLSEKDPLIWFTKECGEICKGWEAGQLFNAISHQQLEKHQKTLNGIDIEKDPYHALASILELPSHMDIVRLYKDVPAKLSEEHGPELKVENDLKAIERFCERDIAYKVIGSVKTANFFSCFVSWRLPGWRLSMKKPCGRSTAAWYNLSGCRPMRRLNSSC